MRPCGSRRGAELIIGGRMAESLPSFERARAIADLHPLRELLAVLSARRA